MARWDASAQARDVTALSNYRSAPIQRVQLSSTTLAYRSFGSGPPLVLIHGWPLLGATYRDLILELQDRFTCIVPDLPGAGDSPWDPTIEEFFTGCAARMEEFVDALGLERFGLVGHDSGGAMARLLAEALPNRVFGLALSNTETPGHVPGVVRLLQLAAHTPGAASVFRVLLRQRWFLRSAIGFGGGFGDLDLLDGEFGPAVLEPLGEYIGGAIAALRCADLKIALRLDDVHQKIRAPLVCVWGDADPFFPVSGAQAMVERWPAAAELHVVPGQKLLVHEESAALMGRCARGFFERTGCAAATPAARG